MEGAPPPPPDVVASPMHQPPDRSRVASLNELAADARERDLIESLEHEEAKVTHLLHDAQENLDRVDEHMRESKGKLVEERERKRAVSSALRAKRAAMDPTVIASLDLRLFKAAAVGDLKQVRELLELGAKGDVRETAEKRTALHEAAKHGHLEVAKELIAHGFNVDVADMYGDTALLDSEHEHAKAMEELLRAQGGAHVLRRDGSKSQVLESDGSTHWRKTSVGDGIAVEDAPPVKGGCCTIS